MNDIKALHSGNGAGIRGRVSIDEHCFLFLLDKPHSSPPHSLSPHFVTHQNARSHRAYGWYRPAGGPLGSTGG